MLFRSDRDAQLVAESTRPGSHRISEAEELRRLIPVLKRLRDQDAVEGVAVQRGKGSQVWQGAFLQWQAPDSVGVSLPWQVLRRGPRQGQFAQGVLDHRLPHRGDTQKDFIARIPNGIAISGWQLGISGDIPEEDVRIE